MKPRPYSITGKFVEKLKAPKQDSAEEEKYFNIPTHRTVAELKQILEKNYSEMLKINFSKKENNQKLFKSF